ncbi:hypothetical protein C0991_006378 [Blastosporella zonata]|nr:hypothetical protein C0991_006378 [Blastosporella zonata]
MDFSNFNSAEQAHMTKIIEKKQMQDFLKMYSNLVEKCFNSCCNDFTSKALSSKEARLKNPSSLLPLTLWTCIQEGCIMNCTEKFIKHSERVGARFAESNAEKDTFKPGKVQIIGLSRDSVQKQKQFVEKEKLTVRIFRLCFAGLTSYCRQYPVLSDVNGEVMKSYGVGKGWMGLAAVARVTIVIDKKGVIRSVLAKSGVIKLLIPARRDTLDAMMNFGAHSKFVAKWLDKFEAEDANTVDVPQPATEESSPVPHQIPEEGAIQGQTETAK